MADDRGKVQISMRAPADMIEDFNRIAQAMERDRTWVMLRALRRYLDEEGADLLREAEGIAALDRGEGIDFDQVMDEADAIIAAARARHLVRKAG